MKRRDFSVAALAACSFGAPAIAQGNKKPEEGIEYVSLDKRVPTEVADGKVPEGKRFRVGGMVPKGSIQRAPGSLTVRFAVTDYAHTVNIEYSGVLPDLFREGQGIIAHGKLDGRGVFVADEVLAKHDENYMPPEVKDALKKTHDDKASAAAGAAS